MLDVEDSLRNVAPPKLEFEDGVLDVALSLRNVEDRVRKSEHPKLDVEERLLERAHP